MMEASLFWVLIFACFFAVFVYILARERDLRFLMYFIFGALAGLFFDLIQVYMGYYQYIKGVYFIVLYGVPVTITLAEGFCIAITVYLYEKIPWFLGAIRPLKK